ncbi:hypothetical protein RSOLAG1IB_10750 [Rhizoctonia solani AG-1 IB]|uniref:Uncharacterized protein n=1 Tax=Thanatephorus cucumeris (strain AG1-IB / isolate 7/3/14) TaxID=1108050 RepID=A0A0B7FZP2_THACB|nr:hypothetical protein RSOLAG1IB_10750 [Rhizoctonia solani AG-1 IB]
MPETRPFQKTIDIEFYKLQFAGEYTDEGSPILIPDGESINVDGVVDIVATTDDYYGIRVVNRSTQDLYAYLIDFSGTSLAINLKTIPILGSSSSDPTLPKNAPLTIGYGSGGYSFPPIPPISNRSSKRVRLKAEARCRTAKSSSCLVKSLYGTRSLW